MRGLRREPEPDVLAEEIVLDLESALEQFRAILEDLGETDSSGGYA